MRLLLWLLLCGGSRSLAQTILLDSFDAGASMGAVRTGTTWVGNVSQTGGTLVVGGSAQDDNGWGATGLTLNLAAMKYITVTGQRNDGHAAPTFSVQLEDRNLNTQVFSVNTAAFAVGALTPVQITVGNWNPGFDPTQVSGWSIGGGGLGVTAFRMTLDQIALSASATPGVPVAPAVSGSYGASTKAWGESVTFTVSATGTTPLTYQWLKNGSTPVAGNTSAATASLTLGNLTALDAGSYTCTVTNAAGSVTSGAFVLTVTATPATVTLANLTTTYTGTARLVTASTNPAGLAVTITYNGSSVPPVSAGNYAVVATVNDPNYTGRAEGTLVVAKAVQSITVAPLPVTIRVGESVAISATATSGGAVALAVVRGNATLSGNSVTPRDTAPVTLRATQAGDANYNSVSVDLAFTTAKQNQSITFAAPTSPITSTAPVALTATASSGLPVSFSVVGGPGRVTGSSLTALDSGVVVVRASQVGSENFNAAPEVDHPIVVTLPAPPQPPTILGAPASRTVTVGSALVLTVTASGDAPLSYQWFKDGAAVTGATQATLTFSAVALTDAGSYRLDVANPYGSIRTNAAIVTVTTASGPPAPRLVNFSTRARAGGPEQVAIAGFVLAGQESKPVLIRAVGPTLVAFGVTDAVTAPKVELFRGSTLVATNTGWTAGGAGAEIAAAAARVGAFALDPNAADAALLASLEPGNYTAVISAADGRAGVGLIEVYDLSEAAAGKAVSNLSVRAQAGVDADTLIVGVVVQGTTPKRMLIRAVGPGLEQFGVTGVLARPQLAIFSGANEVARNTGWTQSPDAAIIAQSSAQAGAFALAADSLDAALIVNLAPGAYTAQVAGAGATSGVALVEVYELP